MRQKTSHLSKGQRTQLALVTAICAEPEVLDQDALNYFILGSVLRLNVCVNVCPSTVSLAV